MKKSLFTILVGLIFMTANAQHFSSSAGKAALGLGIGLPYGGFGGKLSVNPADQFALFAGVGYNLVGVGANFGAQYIFPSKKQTEFFLTGMYGYNAVIRIEGADNLNDTFSGVTAGMGIRINSSRNEGAFWDLGLLVPARSQGYKDAWDDINNNPNITDLTEPWPVQFFFGFNFPLSSRSPK
jgi:hypothetical protein